jgi:predicted ATPase
MIHKITVNNFLNYENLVLDNLPNITVLIGENDTGKTGLLKILYTTSKSLEIYSRKSQSSEVSFKKILAEKIDNTFQPRKNGIGDLVYKGNKEKLSVDIRFEKADKINYFQDIHFSFSESATQNISDCSEQVKAITDEFNVLFVPAKEVLTAFDAIKFTREPNYMLGFDDTYLDLIKALEIPTTKGNIKPELSKVNKDLEDLFDGVINQTEKDGKFIFKKGNTEFSMSMTAEGIKKIGILTTLIRNRQLGKNTILFFDEPETALHPKAVRELVEMLVSMSQAGVQIFLSTHSYFVMKQLSICAKRENFDILCCSLEKNKNRSIHANLSNLKEGLPDNPIIQEALNMFDDEIKLEMLL